MASVATEVILDTFTAGPMARGRVRAALDYEGVLWVEHKTLFDSMFAVWATQTQWWRILRKIGAA